MVKFRFAFDINPINVFINVINIHGTIVLVSGLHSFPNLISCLLGSTPPLIFFLKHKPDLNAVFKVLQGIEEVSQTRGMNPSPLRATLRSPIHPPPWCKLLSHRLKTAFGILPQPSPGWLLPFWPSSLTLLWFLTIQTGYVSMCSHSALSHTSPATPDSWSVSLLEWNTWNVAAAVKHI